jgi:hypothetical protein
MSAPNDPSAAVAAASTACAAHQAAREATRAAGKIPLQPFPIHWQGEKSYDFAAAVCLPEY